MIIEAFLIGTMLANTTGILFLRHVNKQRVKQDQKYARCIKELLKERAKDKDEHRSSV